MSSIPAAFEKAAGWPARGVRAISGRRLSLLSALALLALGTSASGDQAQDILKKMGDVYRNAKAYEGTITIKRSGKGPDGKLVSITTVQQVKYKSPNLFRVSLQNQITGGPPGTPKKVEQLIVSNGKVYYEYSPTQKLYRKNPVPSAVPFAQVMQMMQVGLPGPNTPGAKLLAPTTAQGRAAYVVQISPPATPNGPAARLTIDKQNYQLRKISVSAPQGSLSVDFGTQKMSGSVPASFFAFKPPAGVTEVKAQPAPGGMMPPGGAPPGAPGVPPGTPPR